MLYVAEVQVADTDLTGRMNGMRMWLDRQRFEPSSFRYSPNDTGQSIRVSFKSQTEAVAFAAEFGGSLLIPSVTDSAIAELL
jgi:hypothetical protein